jgi:DNA polymerase-4
MTKSWPKSRSPSTEKLGYKKDVTRKIIHVDMDAFYTSVEQRDRPELRGRPVVVGGSPQSRGVVAAASYEARRYGIRSAMSCAKAERLCPELIFVRPDFQKYRKVSNEIREIFHQVTDLVEPLSLDEAYLDVSTNKLGEPLASKIARWIKDEIKTKTRLTASAGAGSTKFLAKIASDLKKPDGLVVIPPEKALDFIAKLPVEKLWSVGPATAKRLHELGIFSAGDIRKWELKALARELGKHGVFLHQLAHGIDEREVDPNQESKSCGSETTFDKDILDLPELHSFIEELASDVAGELKKMGRPGKTITLKLRYKDFRTITRSKTLERFTDDWKVIAKTASKLLQESTDAGSTPARLIGISVSSLRNENEPEQLWLDLPDFTGVN